MPQNFISCDRDQAMLMPPSLLDWVPEDHVVWTILGAVDELDLSAFYGAYRADGHGRPAFAPPMMVALLLYAYSRGNRSSRGIERACREDVAYMVISAQRAVDVRVRSVAVPGQPELPRNLDPDTMSYVDFGGSTYFSLI